MKLMVISFLIFLMLPLASAISFDFSYPDSVGLNENFSVSISATTSDVYDVKIFVQNNQTGAILSDVYNGGWKNPYYYIRSVFPDQSAFLVRVKNYSDNAVICVRLRKTGSSSYNEKCELINIENIQTSTTNSSDNGDLDNQEEDLLQDSEQNNQDFIPAPIESGEKNQISYNQDNPEKIYLNPKKSSKGTFTTPEGKLRIYTLYFFTAIVVILCIYLAFRKL